MCVATLVLAFHCCLLNGAVYAFEPAVNPFMVRFGQRVLDSVRIADQNKPHAPDIASIQVSEQTTEPDPKVRLDCFELTMHHLEEWGKVLPIRLAVGLLYQRNH